MRAIKTAFQNRFVQFSFAALLFTLLLFLLTPKSINEIVYKQNIYPSIRTFLNYTLGRLPFPALYIIVPLIVFVFIYILIRQILKKSCAKALVFTLSYLALIITIFFWIWGFHYNDKILVPQPDIRQHPIQKEVILHSFSKAENYRSALKRDSISPIIDDKTIQLLSDSGRIWLDKAILLLGDAPAKASNTVRAWPKGFILRWGIVGMYFPFSGEATLDGGLHAIRYPSTLLHEWAHSMGYTNEGDCNLLAYIAAQYSHNPFVRYSAEIERLREEMYFAAMQDSNLYNSVKKELPPIIDKDLIDIRQYHAKYRGVFSKMGNWMNDQYLKTLSGKNGIDEYWLWVIKLHIIEDEHPDIFQK